MLVGSLYVSLGGLGVATVVGRRESRQAGESAVRERFSKTIDAGGSTLAVSATGQRWAFGVSGGDVLLVDANGDVTERTTPYDDSVSHLLLRESNGAMVGGWVTANAITGIGSDGSIVWEYDLPGLWDLDGSADLSSVACVTYPVEGVGSIALVSDGDESWRTRLDDAAAECVAIAESGEHIAVGCRGYMVGPADEAGIPGIQLYTKDGTHVWTYETDAEVVDIGITERKERIVAVTADGELLVVDYAGERHWWLPDSHGVQLSPDGGSVVVIDSSALTVYSIGGERRWKREHTFDSPLPFPPMISEHGERVLFWDAPERTLQVITETGTLWETSSEAELVLGSLSRDGSAWGVMEDLPDEDTLTLSGYTADT